MSFGGAITRSEGSFMGSGDSLIGSEDNFPGTDSSTRRGEKEDGSDVTSRVSSLFEEKRTTHSSDGSGDELNIASSRSSYVDNDACDEVILTVKLKQLQEYKCELRSRKSGGYARNMYYQGDLILKGIEAYERLPEMCQDDTVENVVRDLSYHLIREQARKQAEKGRIHSVCSLRPSQYKDPEGFKILCLDYIKKGSAEGDKEESCETNLIAYDDKNHHYYAVKPVPESKDEPQSKPVPQSKDEPQIMFLKRYDSLMALRDQIKGVVDPVPLSHKVNLLRYMLIKYKFEQRKCTARYIIGKHLEQQRVLQFLVVNEPKPFRAKLLEEIEAIKERIKKSFYIFYPNKVSKVKGESD